MTLVTTFPHGVVGPRGTSAPDPQKTQRRTHPFTSYAPERTLTLHKPRSILPEPADDTSPQPLGITFAALQRRQPEPLHVLFQLRPDRNGSRQRPEVQRVLAAPRRGGTIADERIIGYKGKGRRYDWTGASGKR